MTNVTEGMIQAGVRMLADFEPGKTDLEALAARVYQAMDAAREGREEHGEKAQ
jgi:hypothetical protein